ncbi:hypothetical protein Tco_0937269 [Tanacetum coccineum]|uniref:Uncharacterized protein n=1 Tax=Tanacetum coccineum TaxID=301880 RepID=A0ABQ5DKT3_9ASTR
MDAMTLKLDAQYKELQSNAKKTKPDLDEDDIPMSREEKAKFMQTFRKNRFYNDYRDRDSNRDNWRLNERSSYNRDNYQSNIDDKSYDLQKQFNNFMKSQQSTNAFVKETFMDLKTQLETVAKNHQASIQNLETKFDRLANKQSGRPSGSLPNSSISADSLQTPIPTQPSSSRSQKKQSKRKQRKDTTVTQEEPQQDDSVPTPSINPPLSVLGFREGKGCSSKEIADLKKESEVGRKKKSDTQGRSIKDIDKDADVSLVDDTQGRLDDADMFDIEDLHGDEVNVDMPVGDNKEQSAKEREVDTSVEDSATPTTIEEITLAQTLIQIKVAKTKVVTTAATATTTRPKARGVVLEAELIEEEKLARKQEEEANIALIESWDNTQAMMEADFELAQRLQTETRRE